MSDEPCAARREPGHPGSVAVPVSRQALLVKESARDAAPRTYAASNRARVSEYPLVGSVFLSPHLIRQIAARFRLSV
jgi:hypothetical protein